MDPLIEEDPDARPRRLVVLAATGIATATVFATTAAVVAGADQREAASPDFSLKPTQTSRPHPTSWALSSPMLPPPPPPSSSALATSSRATRTQPPSTGAGTATQTRAPAPPPPEQPVPTSPPGHTFTVPTVPTEPSSPTSSSSPQPTSSDPESPAPSSTTESRS